MTQVFISYSRKDLEFVDRLANDLKATGFVVWYDLSGLEAGTRWGNEIQKAIQESQYFLVVLSPNSVKSDWVEREFLYASDKDLKIIPLLYQPCSLPMWSLNLHFINMQGKNYALHYQDLLKVMGVKTGSEEENPIAIRYLEIGDEYRKRGQASQAIESYLQALKVDPENLKARTNIGAVHLLEQDYSQAVEAYELALQISSEDMVAIAGFCDANMALGNQARADGRIEDAIHYYLEILRIDPAEPDARKSLVNIYTSRAESSLASGQEDEALSALSEAIKYSPDDPGLTSRLEKMRMEKKTRILNDLITNAEAEISAGNWGQGLASLNEALQIAPQEASILKRIAQIQGQQLRGHLEVILSKVDLAEKEQRWDAAMGGLNEYLQLKPDDTSIQKRMADLMYSKHAAWLNSVTLRVDQALANRNRAAALAAIHEALSLEPDNKELLARAAEIKKDQLNAKLNAILMRADQAAAAGRWDDSIEILNTGLLSDPGNVTLKAKLEETLQTKRKTQLQSVLDLTDAAARAGKWDDAITSLNEVLAIEPDNAEFLEKYNHILKQERTSKLETLQTRAKILLKEEKFEESLAAWNEILLLAPDNRQAVLAEIEAVNNAQKLEADYAAGFEAFAAKDYRKAVDLFNAVQVEQAGYKDATRLLAKARKLLRPDQRSSPGRKSIWVLITVLTILVVGIGSLISWQLLKEKPTATTVPTQVMEITAVPTNAPIQATSSPLPLILNPANQHQYLYSEYSELWSDARDNCAELGGYLVTIQDATENQFVFDLTQGNTWLGATDQNKEGTWEWVSGESWIFPNWYSSQPDNDGDMENYLSYLVPESPYHWNDLADDYKQYTCEWDPAYDISTKFPQRMTITVTSVEDTGPGTLRQALLEARAGDMITFNPATFPPDNPVAINLYSGLPVIDQGYLTLDASNAGVVLNGSHVGGEWTAGIDIWSDHNIIKGLGIIGFSGPGIALQANANFNTIGGDRGIGIGQLGEGNFFGANSDGMAILGSDNVITGNLVGILGADSEDFEVGNRASGIFIDENASRNTIGPNNIVAYNGTVAGCGIDYMNLDVKDNILTANIIYENKPDAPGICYNINPGGQFVYSTPPTILYFDLDSGTAAGQSCPECLVEIFSTDTQDAKIFEGVVTADEYGNFVYHKSGTLTGPYLTATSRSPGENTSEFSLPTSSRTDLMIAQDAVWTQKPVFETTFNTWIFWKPDPGAILKDGKLLLSNDEDGWSETGVRIYDNLSFDKFAVEGELRIEGAGIVPVCSFRLVGNDGIAKPNTLTIELRKNNKASLNRVGKDNYYINTAAYFDFNKSIPVKIISLGDQLAIFIDGQTAYTWVDPSWSTINYSYVELTATNNVMCEFDNFKLWDLRWVKLNP